MRFFTCLLPVLCLIAALGKPAFAQNYNPLRVEFEPKFEPEKYHIVPAGKENMILFKETDNKPEWGKRYWEATAYNGTFDKTWEKEFAIGKKMQYASHKLVDGNLHIFFVTEDKPYKKFRIVSINNQTGDVKTTGKEFPQKLKTVAFNAHEEKAFITGTTDFTFTEMMGENCVKFTCLRWIFGITAAHTEALVYEVNLDNHEMNLIPQQYEKNGFGLNASIHPDKTTDLFIAHMTEKYARDLYMKTYDDNRSLVDDKKVKTKSKKALINGQSKQLKGSGKLVVGPYAAPPEERTNEQKGETKFRAFKHNYDSRGFYLTKFKNRDQQFIRYFDLGEDFESFSTSGKSTYASFVFNMHDIMLHKGNYILIAENYHPVYSISYSRGVKSGETLIGFKPTKALAIAFDQNGKKVWDNIIDLQKKEQGSFFKKSYKDFMSLDKNVTTKINDEGELVMIFADDGKVFNTVIKNGDIVSQEKGLPIPTKNKQDDVKHNYYTNLDHWYDNYYIAWGYQKVDQTNGERKKVFYFNKIALEEK